MRVVRAGTVWGRAALYVTMAVTPAAAQTVGTGDPAPGIVWTPISMAGVARANGRVDSVFLDRHLPQHTISGGDWVSYLAARLGALPIPDTTGIRVAVDSQRILVDGRIGDLPPETRQLFGPLMMFLDSTSVIRAEVVMAPTGPGVVRFVLATMSVNGYQIPEALLSRFLVRVGQEYPVLTRTGRELLVAVPEDGRVRLVENGVRLWVESARGSPP